MGFCPTDLESNFRLTTAMLPSGPAWEAATVPNTVQNRFWRAIATVVQFVNTRLCNFEDELHCHSAIESLDQWRTEYGFTPDNPCDPYGVDLCEKIKARGGQDIAHLVEVAARQGWSITVRELIEGTFDCQPCDQGRAVRHPYPEMWHANAERVGLDCPVPGSRLGIAGQDCGILAGDYVVDPPTRPEDLVCGYTSNQDTLPIAGAMQAGCTILGPKPMLVCEADNCDYERAVGHPNPELFNASSDRSDLACPMPGSILGSSDVGCCRYAGEFYTDGVIDKDFVAEAVCDPPKARRVFNFPVPQRRVQTLRHSTDSTGKFMQYQGYANQMEIIVDLAASNSEQAVAFAEETDDWSYAGRIEAGCSALNRVPPASVACALQSVIPAHVTTTYRFVN